MTKNKIENNFQNFKLSNQILENLKELNYKEPTQIQKQAIPQILKKKDILGLSQTGTGKTAAFSLPILEQLIKLEKQTPTQKNQPKTIILEPNRELTMQTLQTINQFSKNLKITTIGIYGGLDEETIQNNLNKIPQIIVATPGKLLEYLTTKTIQTIQLQHLILDEVDKMLDKDSIYEIKKIIKLLPKKKQNLFFSATANEKTQEIIDELLINPVKIEIQPELTTPDKITQHIYYVAKDNKFKLLLEILQKREVKSTIIFINSRLAADNLVRYLTNNNIKSEALHSQKSNVHREKVIRNISSKKTKHIIATDLASRGLDIENISHVINFELPNNPRTYIHRIGRTARAEKTGQSISFCAPDEKHFLNQIEKTLKNKLIEIKHNYHLEKAKKVTGADSKPKHKKKKDQKNKTQSKTIFTINPNSIKKSSTKYKKKKLKK